MELESEYDDTEIGHSIASLVTEYNLTRSRFNESQRALDDMAFQIKSVQEKLRQHRFTPEPRA